MPSRRLRRALLAMAGLFSLGLLGWVAAVWWLEHRFLAAPAQSHIDTFMAQRGVPGFSAAAAKHGAIIWSQAFGYADLERKIPAAPAIRFRVHSVSKCLTAAALALLHQEGRLDLDVPIRRYVPSFPEKSHPITARQLASHRAGIRGYRDDSESINTRHYPTATASLEKFQHDPLLFEPDTDSFYSSYGYVLLSAAIEGATADTFPDHMRRRIFERLGMHSTAEVGARQESAGYDDVTPYSTDGSRVLSPFNDYSNKWAGGGFSSTAEDLVLFGSAHFEGSFLKRETVRLFWTPRTPRWSPVGVAMGWMVLRDWRLRKMVFHFGAGSGGTSLLLLYPDQGTAIALLANLGHAKFSEQLVLGVARQFLPGGPTFFPEGLAAIAAAAWALYFWRRRFHPYSVRTSPASSGRENTDSSSNSPT